MAANKAGPGAIGLRLLNFSRVRIQHYVPTPNFTSRAELPRSWQEATEAPLVWKVTEPAEMPQVEQPLFEDAPEPKQEGFPPDLVRILEAHQARQAAEAHVSQTDATPVKALTAQGAKQEAPRSQIVRKEVQRPQAPAEPPRPQTVQRQPAPPQTRPAQRPVEKAGLLEEVTPAAQIPTVEAGMAADSWVVEENVVPEDTPVVPLDLQLDDVPPVADEAQAENDNWLPTHPIPAPEVQPAPTSDPSQPETVKPVQPAKPAARPESAQRKAERQPDAPSQADQPPIVSALVGKPQSAAPMDFSLPLLSEEEFDKETERVEYISPDDDSSILMNTPEARVSRLDSIHRSLEAVQRNLDSIQRFVGPPDSSPPEQADYPAVEDSAEEAATDLAEQTDQPPVEGSTEEAAQGFWHEPTLPTEVPAVQRAEYQPQDSPDNPPEPPPAPGQQSATPLQDSPEAPADETPNSMLALPLAEPELPEESSDLVIALQSAETAMPTTSEMRDFEPSVWATPETPQNGHPPQLISRTPETTASSPPSNGSPGHPVVDTSDAGFNDNAVGELVPLDPSLTQAGRGENRGFANNVDNAVDPLNGATADLLKLLDLPPDTPIAGMKDVVRRSESEYIEAEDEPPANPIQDMPLDVALMGGVEQTVMREPATPAVSASTSSNGSLDSSSDAASESDEGDQEPNIDRLARDVHRILRERLRIEQERRSDR